MTERDDLKKKIISCKDCRLYDGKTLGIPGYGKLTDHPIMFVSDSPSYWDSLGRLLTGKPGKLFDDCLKGIGLTRDEIYLTNLVKHPQPKGRSKLLPDEIESCQGYLLSEIKLIDPKIIVAVGSAAAGFFFENEGVTKVMGQVRPHSDGRFYLALVSPAGAIRDSQRQAEFERDFDILGDVYHAIKV